MYTMMNTQNSGASSRQNICVGVISIEMLMSLEGRVDELYYTGGVGLR